MSLLHLKLWVIPSWSNLVNHISVTCCIELLAVISIHKPTEFSFGGFFLVASSSNVYLLGDINSSPIMPNRAIELDNLCGDVCHSLNWNASKLDKSETTYNCCRYSAQVWSRTLEEWRAAKINYAGAILTGTQVHQVDSSGQDGVQPRLIKAEIG